MLDLQEAFSALEQLQLLGLLVALVEVGGAMPVAQLGEVVEEVEWWELEQQQLQVQQEQLQVVEEEEQVLLEQELLQLEQQLAWRRLDQAGS